MIDAMSLSDLARARSLLDQGRIGEMYDLIKAFGHRYAGLASGVARGNMLSGLTALEFLESTAESIGKPLQEGDVDRVRRSMADAYLRLLEHLADEGGGVVAREITSREAWDFHNLVFINLGYTEDCWTLNTPFRNMSDAQRDALWDSLLNSNGRILLDTAAGSELIIAAWRSEATGGEFLDWFTRVAGPEVTSAAMARFSIESIQDGDVVLKPGQVFASFVAAMLIDVADNELNPDQLDEFIATATTPLFFRQPLYAPVQFGSGGHDVLDDNGDVDIMYGLNGNDNLNGGAGSDVLYGGNDNDKLGGGAGIDILYGDDGADVLEGGAGNDSLYGGAGFDTYVIETAEASSQLNRDRILDADGQGAITIDGQSDWLAGVRATADGVWESHGGRIRIVRTIESGSSQLTISVSGTNTSVVVQGWQAGQLGIDLPAFTPAPAEGGDLTAGDDVFGELDTNGGDDRVSGHMGNDGLEGGAGADVLDGGAGEDLIFGGSGNDRLIGGDGDDVILDGSELQNMRAWDNVDRDAQGKTELDRVNEEIARLGAAVVAKGAGWFISTDGSGISSGSALHGQHLDIHMPSGERYLDPNVSPSGDDLIDAGAGADKVYSGEGNDTVLGGNDDDQLHGGADDDILSGGDGNDQIVGDTPPAWVPREQLTALVSDRANPNGHDVIDAGDGNDNVIGGGGNDVIAGGEGDDDLSGYGFSTTRAVDLDDADQDHIDGGTGNDKIFGDDGDDRLIGGIGNDLIRGDNGYQATRYGDDRLDGGLGDDILQGDGANDTLYGGQGADDLRGDGVDIDPTAHGKDHLDGGVGNDTLSGGGGADTLLGGDGSDTLVGDAHEAQLAIQFHGDDHLSGGAGNDTAWGGGGNDLISGGTGDDQLSGDDGDDVISGDDGHDLLVGGAGLDTLQGGLGNDRLSGNEGDDTLSGGSGADEVYGNEGNDLLLGGADDDALGGGAGRDQLSGEAGNDRMSGHEDNDVLDGGEGNDRLWGDQGADTLIGGRGSDELTGGEGNDLYVFNPGWGVDTIHDLSQAGAGQDTIRFGIGIDPATLEVTVDREGSLKLKIAGTEDVVIVRGFADMTNSGHRIEFADGTVWTMEAIAQRFRPGSGGLYGDTAGNVIVGTSGGDRIDGNLGDDVLIGGEGQDIIDGGAVSGDYFNGTDNDVIFGGAGDDLINGQEGDDEVFGGEGNDEIDGGPGADRLFGGDGNDTLDASWWEYHYGRLFQDRSNDLVVGGRGNDALEGGLGVNTYYFEAGHGADHITLTQASDYEAGLDVPSERAILRFGPNVNAGDIRLSRIGTDLEIRYGADIITVLSYAARADATVELVFDDGSSITAEQLAFLSEQPGSALSEKLAGGAGNDELNGLGGNDIISGNKGNDVLSGGAGRDRLLGGEGNDTYRYELGDGVDEIAGTVAGQDELALGQGITRDDITIYREPGNEGASTLYIFFQPTGNYIRMAWQDNQVDQAVDLVRFANGAVISAVDLAAAALPFNLQLSFVAQQGDVEVHGNQYANSLYGVSATQSVPPRLIGGQGDDQYYLRSWTWQGTPVEYADGGNDTVFMDFHSYTMGDHIENLIVDYNNYIEDYPRTFVGNSLSNTIDVSGAGGPQAFRLDGGAGADVLIGGWTNDTFVLDSQSDQFFESSASSSIDTVEAAFSFSIVEMPAIENVTLFGAGDTVATGNGQANLLDSTASSGNNTLIGGAGDDTYLVGAGDRIVELAAEGHDTVVVGTGLTGTYHLSAFANVEDIRLAHSAGSSSIVGNDEANGLTGNNSANEIHGGGGDDRIRDSDKGPDYRYSSGDDRDILNGGDGNDVISSWWGMDRIIGGRGNDTISAGRDSHVFVYNRGDGHDAILDSGGYGDAIVLGEGILPHDVHFERQGTTLVVRFGVDSTDRIDVLEYWNGDGTRADRIESIHFPDGTYWSGSDIDGRLGGAYLVGTDAQDTLVGTDHMDTLIGSGGNDLLEGRGGNDLLLGGRGDDIYQFGTGTGADRILSATDGADGRDVIRFAAGVDLAALRLARTQEGDLVISFDGAQDSITVASYFAVGASSYELHFADGTVLSSGDIAQRLLVGYETDDRLYGYDSDDTIHGNGGNDQLFGQGGRDSLYGGAGNDHLDGGDGDDAMVGGAGDDVYVVDRSEDVLTEEAEEGYDTVRSDVSFALAANFEALHLSEGTAVNASGNNLANSLSGNSNANRLDGGSGADYMAGAGGDDIYIVDDAGDTVIEYFDSGFDTVYSSVSYSFGDTSIEKLVLTGSGSINATGNPEDNVLIGNSGNNVLDGGPSWGAPNGGSDVMVGGAGDDTYVVDSVGDVVTELSNEGRDLVRSSVSYNLGEHVESLTLTGSAAISGSGNGLNNVLIGNRANNVLSGGAGSDTLNGGAGSDTMLGGSGDDLYVVGDGTDVVTEYANQGLDTVQSAVSYVLSEHVENLSLTGSGVIDGTGNALDNVLIGNGAVNVLTGGGGNDVLNGGANSDRLIGGAGNDRYVVDVATDELIEAAGEGIDVVESAVTLTLASNIENLLLTGSALINGTGNDLDNVLTGNSAANTLTGGAGNDTLDGRAGNDTLVGGEGSDTYVVGSTADVVTEQVGQGVDTVESSVTLTLAANVENLVLTGASNLGGTGNELANVLTGNSGANSLSGGAGNDTLNGGAGNDTLNGGAGADVLQGGTGDDIYTINDTTDTIVELVGEGNDLVQSSVTHSLVANVERLTLTGTSAINGTGNALDNVLNGNGAVNTLTGGAGNDILDGRAGGDKLSGGEGDDTYFVDSTSDVVTELVSQGTDTVQSRVTWTLGTNLENLTLDGSNAVNGTGNSAANVLIGNAANNVLSGLAGDDTLEGAAGTDMLTGGTGKDTYVMARGYGADTVVENDTTTGQLDVAKFLSGIAYDQLWFARPSGTNNLEISIIGTSDRLVIKDWYLGSQYRVEEIRTVDGGRVMAADKVQALVTEMAKLTKPVAGQTTLPASYRTQLDPVFASTWSAASPTTSMSSSADPMSAEILPAMLDTSSTTAGLTEVRDKTASAELPFRAARPGREQDLMLPGRPWMRSPDLFSPVLVDSVSEVEGGTLEGYGSIVAGIEMPLSPCGLASVSPATPAMSDCGNTAEVAFDGSGALEALWDEVGNLRMGHYQTLPIDCRFDRPVQLAGPAASECRGLVEAMAISTAEAAVDTGSYQVTHHGPLPAFQVV